MNNIHPCLWFNGNAKEAATFYCSLFPESVITTDTLMVVSFKLNGQKFMGLNGGPHFTFNPSTSMFVTSESNDEIDALYTKLMDGGKVMMALDKYDWSDYYAFVQDRFGMAWQLYKGNYSSVNQKITPCFLFVDGQFGKAAAAINYYTSLFPSSSVSGILLYQQSEGALVAGKVKHAQFVIDDKVFMAMDGPGNHGFAFNEAISFVVECKDQEEIDKYWDTLIADGGKESMCGWLKDQFGVSWQIIPAGMGKLMTDPVNGPKAMQALMQMKKIVIAGLQG